MDAYEKAREAEQMQGVGEPYSGPSAFSRFLYQGNGREVWFVPVGERGMGGTRVQHIRPIGERFMLKAIYLDMDGVLVDFVGACFKLFGVHPNRQDAVDGWDAMPKALSAELGREVKDAELWSRVGQAGRQFWANIDWLPWGRELVELCSMHAPVVLMTADSGPLSAAGKIDWIAREMPKEWLKRYAVTSIKHHMAHPGALLIDDGQHNYDAFTEHGGECFLWPAPWNSKRDEALADPSRSLALEELAEALELMTRGAA